MGHSKEQSAQFSTDQLLPLAYEELRRLAACKMQQERPDLTIQATALVHEAYLRLVQGRGAGCWENREHLVMAFAEAMRRILVEGARRRASLKRGGHIRRCAFDEGYIGDQSAEELLALDDSLTRFSAVDPLKANIVRLRFFANFTIPEISEALGISPRTVDRHWAYARAWLLRDMETAQARPPHAAAREESLT